MLKPDAPARPGVPGRAARARARLLPGGRLRRAGAAARARHPAARLGQPALLAAARLARRGAGAARALAGDEVTGATTFRLVGAGHRPGVRRGDRADPPRRHRRRPARAGSPRAAPGCWSRPSTASRTARSRPATAAGRRRLASRRRSPSTTRGSTGPARRVAVDRLVRACTPAPGAWTTFGGERLKLGPVDARRPTTPLAPGELEVDQERACWSAPARTPVRLGEVQAARQASRCRPPTGRAGPRLDGRRAVRRERPRAPGHATPAPRSRRSTRPGRRRFDVLAAVARATTPTPTWCCRRCCATRGLDRPRRGVRHRAGLRHAAPAAARYDAVLAACVDRPLAKVDPPVLDVLRLGAHQLLAMRVPAARRGRHHRRAGPRRGRRTAPAGFVNAVLRKVAAPRPGGLGRAGSRPTRRPTRSATSRRARAPAVDRRRASRDALGGRRDELRRRCSPPTTTPPQVTSSPGPGCSTRRRAVAPAARDRPLVAVRRACSPAATPAELPAVARGPGRRAGRGQPAGRARRSPRRRVDGPRRALARPVRRARRQGRAARRRWPAERGAGLRRRRAAAAPRRGWSRRRCAAADGRARRRRRRRPAPPWRRRRLRPGAGRRPVHRARARCGAGPRRAGGARPTDVADAGAAAARAARRGARRGPARRRGRLRDLLAAPRRDPRRRRRACSRSRDRRRRSRTRGRCCPACPTLGAVPGTCSCGRTGTAPTRCSWRCCAER